MRTLTVCLVFWASLAGCRQPAEPPQKVSSAGKAVSLPAGAFSPAEEAKRHPTFGSYWYQGRAELSRFALRQARYGDVHDGNAVLVFVTEDFLPDVQVKHERGERPDAVGVLKLNAHRQFFTGIYPYSVLTSTFTPVLVPTSPALKVSTTVQEWCGHVYAQINRRGPKLISTLHSYFEGEADQSLEMKGAPLEDAVWSRIRMDPGAIREGRHNMVPALHYMRMRHRAFRAYPVVIEKESSVTTELLDGVVDVVRLKYSALSREVSIYYDPAFPRQIRGWEETVGPHKTTAVLTNSLMTDYWNRNGADDGAFRTALGL